MEIVGRADQPWDALFIFHFFAEGSIKDVTEELRNLIVREMSTGLELGRPVMAKNKAGSFEILGCFLEQYECTRLLSAWNQPESDDCWMCYVPNHGIATITEGKLDWWALICFYCCNAGLGGPSARVDNPYVPNRSLPEGALLEKELIALLPPRTFPVRGI